MNLIQRDTGSRHSMCCRRPPRGAWPALLATLVLSGCGSGGDAPAPAAAPISAPTGPVSGGPSVPAGRYVINGEVFSFEQGMIADAAINITVYSGALTYSYWWAYGPLHSDGIGLFKTVRLPGTVVSVTAHKAEYAQPCAIVHKLESDLAVRVELIPRSAFNGFNTPRPQLSVEPGITGTVYEITDAGRQPVDGASLWVEEGFEDGVARTWTDLGGGFFLCNLGRIGDVKFYVSKPGYRDKVVSVGSIPSGTIFEIEMTRQ